MKDRRKFPRFSSKWRVTYQVSPEETPVEQETVNISGGGICFTSDNPIDPGKTVSLELDSDSLPSTVFALARVVWCRKTAETYEVGAEFESSPEYAVGAKFEWIGWKNEILNEGKLSQFADAPDSCSKEMSEK